MKRGIQRFFAGKLTFAGVMVLLLAALLVSILLAVQTGSTQISWGDILNVVKFRLFGAGDPEVYGKGAVPDIVWYIRLPRLMLAVAVGAALAVCGVIMQAIVKNPLADPYVQIGRASCRERV